MKRQSSTRESINLGKLIYDQENAVRYAIDELVTLQNYIEFDRNITDDSFGIKEFKGVLNIQAQLKVYRRKLFDFPIKCCAKHVFGFYPHCKMLECMLTCFYMFEDLERSKDLMTDTNADWTIDGSMKMLERSLDYLIEIKEYNGLT